MCTRLTWAVTRLTSGEVRGSSGEVRELAGKSGIRKRGRRNGVASDFFCFFSRFLPFFRFLPISSDFFFRFPSSDFFFRFPFFLFWAVFLRVPIFFVFFLFSVSSVSFQEKKNRGDTVRETPFAKLRVSGKSGKLPGNFWIALKIQQTAKGASGKGPRQKKKVSKNLSTLFDFSRREKKLKNRQKMSKLLSTLFDNFHAAPVSQPPGRSSLIL